MQQAAGVFGWIRRGGRLAVTWLPRGVVLAGQLPRLSERLGQGHCATSLLCAGRKRRYKLVVILRAKYITANNIYKYADIFIKAANFCMVRDAV
jgi:hypothetical protein